MILYANVLTHSKRGLVNKMRKPRTESENRAIVKYESIVKKYVDELDPINLFPNAPKDEYKREIREIVVRLYQCKSFLDVAQIMYVVFAYKFDLALAAPEAKYLNPAKKIFEEMKNIRNEK